MAIEDLKEWFEQANKDFSTAKYLASGKKYVESAFYCQQSVEKAFKAVLLQKESSLIKTHDLLFLAERIKLPVEMRNICKELSLIYIYSRYPTDLEVKNLNSKVKKYLVFTKEILEWTKKQLRI